MTLAFPYPLPLCARSIALYCTGKFLRLLSEEIPADADWRRAKEAQLQSEAELASSQRAARLEREREQELARELEEKKAEMERAEAAHQQAIAAAEQAAHWYRMAMGASRWHAASAVQEAKTAREAAARRNAEAAAEQAAAAEMADAAAASAAAADDQVDTRQSQAERDWLRAKQQSASAVVRLNEMTDKPQADREGFVGVDWASETEEGIAVLLEARSDYLFIQDPVGHRIVLYCIVL